MLKVSQVARMEYEAIAPNVQRNLYRLMLRIRRTEEKLIALYPDQEIRTPCHLYIGQEAIAAGVCANLRPDDYALSTWRGHGLYVAKGGDLKTMMAEMYGKVTGCTKGKGGSMHLAAPEVGLLGCSAIVGGTMPIAVGAALTSVMQGIDRIAVAFFGDGAVDEGSFHESLNFASLKKLPVLFICENNFYAVHSHQRDRQPGDNIYQRAEGYLMPGVRVDGSKVLDVYMATRKAVERARNGEGPTLIECRAYRWLEHVGPKQDFDLGYRTLEEAEEWMRKCPVESFRELLLSNRIVPESELDEMTRQIDEELDQAVAFGKASPFPDEKDMYDGVFR